MLGALQAVLPGAAFAQGTTAKLISLWGFDETDSGSTTFHDSGPAKVDMVIHGTWADLSTESMVQGVSGTSAYTDGSAYATIPASRPDHNLAALTISLYYQRNSAAAKHILLAAGNATQAGDFSIEVLANGMIRSWHVGQDGVVRFFESTNGITGTNLAVGTAYRIDLVLGPLGAEIFLNGVSKATISANTNGWNNARVKYLGIWTDGVQAAADGAFDRLRLWRGQPDLTKLEAAQSITLPSFLPQVPSLEFLASDGTIPGTGVVYVYDTSLGNGSGSSAANAKEIQAAINAASAGQTLVAVAATPGGTSFYNRPSGLTFPVSGAAGNPITLMARPDDTVVIDRGQEFATYRTPSSGLSTKWEIYDASKYIWRSVDATYGSTVRPLGGFWFEGGWPHYILPCDNLTHLSAPLGQEKIWTNYGSPCAIVYSDGRIYVRWQIPDPNKMSYNNKWPIDGRCDYIPGWVSKSGSTTGQLHFPATQDPRDYEIYLTDAPGNLGGTAFNLTNRSYVTIGDGMNSVGHEIGFQVSGASNITINRGTDFTYRFGILCNSTTANGVSVNRRRMTHSSIRHQPLVNWKFGGVLENAYRGAWIDTGPSTSNHLNNLVARDCTLFGWHDLVSGGGTGWDIQQCAVIFVMDDGFQGEINRLIGLNLHYCYFLDSPYGGPGGSGTNTDAMYVSHNIFDNRMPRYEDVGSSMNPYPEPYAVPLMQLHINTSVQQPIKFFNNTTIFPPDVMNKRGNWMQHIFGDVAVDGSHKYHENFNNIVVTTDYQRYTGNDVSGGLAWGGQNDMVVNRIILSGSREIYDYHILHRDVPNVQNAIMSNICTSAISGQTPAQHGGKDFTSLAAFLADAYFTTSKGTYSPGFFAHSYQVDPQIPSCPSGGSLSSLDARRDYRPRASEASNGYSSRNANSPAGEAYTSWTSPCPKWSSWIGALDPTAATMPIGVQNP